VEGARFVVFDVVAIADSEETSGLEVAGAEGVVLGVTEDETTCEEWRRRSDRGLA
jgi:hypothetical protein